MPPSAARWSRRQFLQAAGAAVTLPTFLPRVSHAQPSANDRLQIALIGCGNIGRQHIGTFLGDPDVRLVAVCDVDADKRADARQRIDQHYNAADGRGCAAYNEYERVLERDDVDAVIIATPDHWHGIMAVAACQAGKDVYCEKPLSLTVREAQQMVAAARRYGTVFQTGSQQRSDANFRVGCELVRNGYIGKLLTVNVGVGETAQLRWLPAEAVPAGLDWDRWQGPASWHPFNPIRIDGSWGGDGWRWVRAYSGGMMTDWGAHHFDIAQWGMGTDDTGPIAIAPPGDETGPQLTFRYANGVTMYRGGANGVLFTGTDGKVEVNRGYLRTWPDELAQIKLKPGDTRLYRSPGHQQDWLDCIRTRRRPICDVSIGAHSAIVCHLGNIALWVDRPIRWDPDAGVLLDDPVAARWLDRPKRAPYQMPSA
jgi:predicted dehydrogenase